MAALEAKASPSGDSSVSSHPEPPKIRHHARPSASFLPPWITGPLKSRRAWKTLFRCWIAVFAAFVILLPDASLRTIGTTGFFALLTSLFLPPYLPVQLTIFLLSTLMIGLLAGWGIGVGAMRAANHVRNQAHIQAVGAQIQASIKENPVFQANPALATSTAIFNGWFLDTRATAVYGGFLAIGGLIFGLIRAYAPKLLFMSIFGTIAVDIFCTVGPLFPTKRYTLLNSTSIAIACYMAIALVTTIFVFPETMSHATLDSLVAQLARVQKLIEMQDDVLAAGLEDQDFGGLLAQFMALRRAAIATQQQLTATSGFLSLEFSWARWNGNDIRSLEDPVTMLITRAVCLLNFDRLAETTRPSPPNPGGDALEAQAAPSLQDARWTETSLLRAIHTRQAALEAAHGVRPADVLPQLDESTRALRHAAVVALTALGGMITHVNHTRWARNPGSTEAATLDEAGARLDEALRAFKEEGRLELLAPFQALLDAHTDVGKRDELPLRSLYISYVFVANMVSVAEAVQALVRAVQAINAKRSRARLWAPASLRAGWKVLVARGDKADGAFGEDTSPLVEEVDEKIYKRDPDSRPPTNPFQKVMHAIHHAFLWTRTAEAVFTFKYMFISIALWLPAVIRHSAHFYYVEKGIWALIMAQTTLNIYASDQIFNYFTRIGGTFVGLVFGLLAWYAGNASGNGNPYGAAAAYGVFVFPLLFLRVFSPERYLSGVVMCCATFALVVGYSWVDGHTVQFATPGIGWSVAWKRWALVVVGCAASFILMIFPSQSGRKAVRMRNAASIASLASTYAFLVSAWIGGAANLNGEDPETDPTEKQDTTEKQQQAERQTPAWGTAFRGRLLALAEEMQTIRELTGLARWEGSIRGKWPAAEYTRLVDVQVDMIAIFAQLGTSLGHLEHEWRSAFLQHSKVLNPDFIADVTAAFSLISQSLRTGEPMHQVLPTSLLDRLFYHDNHGHLHARAATVPDGIADGAAEDVERIKSLEYMYYASSVVSVYQLLRAVDELHSITKELCGEIPLTGFSAWREEYERAHAVV